MRKNKTLRLHPRKSQDVIKAEEIAARVREQYKDDPNVLGVGRSLKVKGGVAQPDKLVLTFFVRDKLPIAELKERGLTPIPEIIEGMPTDVEPTKARPLGKALPARRQRRDPLVGGIAIGNSDRQWRYGTLGCIVFDNASGEERALTNEHVLVFTNPDTGETDGDVGDSVIQPAPPRLEDFIDLDFTPSCCPVGPIFFVELAGPISGFLSWGAVMAAAVACSDERDPTRRGQDHTLPAPGERTVREVVDVNIEYPEFPIPGTPYKVDVDWNYTRQTTGASYNHRVKETNTNPHVLDRQGLLTNKKAYQRREMVHLLADITPRSGPKPCTSYHVIADLVPADKAQSDHYHQVILHPTIQADMKQLMAIFPKLQDLLQKEEQSVDFHNIPPNTELPYMFTQGGLTFRHLTGNALRAVDFMPVGQPDGTSELRFDPQGIGVDLRFPSEWVSVHVAQFTAKPVSITAFDSRGQTVGSNTSPAEPKVEHVLEVQGADITRVEIKGGGGEGILLGLSFGRTATKKRCLYYGRTRLNGNDPLGQWDTFLFVQTINDVLRGTEPEKASKTIGGLPVTCNFAYTGEGSVPSLGTGCIFQPNVDGDFKVLP